MLCSGQNRPAAGWAICHSCMSSLRTRRAAVSEIKPELMVMCARGANTLAAVSLFTSFFIFYFLGSPGC